jgi:NAD(P)-dependent dehydrogenase (short-subunit alcohol dehydrogenase family)
MAKTVAVLGARNLGGAIIDRFLELGWNAAGVARSDETLERVRRRGALALGADAADMASLRDALATVKAELGSLDAVVNAVSAARPPSAGPSAAVRSPRRTWTPFTAGRWRWRSRHSCSCRSARPRSDSKVAAR